MAENYNFAPSPVLRAIVSEGGVLSPTQLAAEKENRYQEFYRPIEEQFIAGLFNPAAREAEVATNRTIVRGEFDNANRALSQTQERYGAQPTGDMADFMNRRARIEAQLAETQAANETRGLVYDRDLQHAQSMSAMARGLSGQVSSGVNTAAQMASAREQQGQANKAAQRQSMFGLAGTLGGIGLAAAFL